MFLGLFGLGLLITAGGIVTIGLGIPIKAFNLGNTLILSGTVAVVGGFILIGLAAQIRQMNRLAEMITSRPVARPAATGSAEVVVYPTARIPEPPVCTAKPPEVVMPSPAEPRPVAVETRYAAAAESSGLPDWLRSKSRTASDVLSIAVDPAVIDVPDNAPLSPHAPQRSVLSPPPFSTSLAGEQPVESNGWSPSREGATHEAAPKDAEAEMPDPPSRAEHVARMTPAMERRKDAVHKDPEWFNVVWPDAQSRPLSRAEPAARDPTSKLPPAPHPIQEKRVERAFEHPVAIVKSGVIDGMAFTVYVDGSIEAELPQGIIKFASLDALRAHVQPCSPAPTR